MVIKVCGMRKLDNITQLDQLGVDYMGLIFYDKSPRYVGKYNIPATRTKKVGVFVNHSIAGVITAIQTYNLAGIQLHGIEDVAYIKELRHHLNLHSLGNVLIFKAFRVTETLTTKEISSYENDVDLFILDSGGKSYGGNGKRWDYSLLQKLSFEKSFLLSGGIDDTISIDELINLHPLCIGVDLNSGFEIEPGIKDIEKLKQYTKRNSYE